MNPAIEAHELVKTYREGRKKRIRALDDLTFSVAAGSLCALLGPNGAGKTSAVKILTTLSFADTGQARVAGLDVRRHPDRVRAIIGVVPQKSTGDVTATARENLILQGQLYGLRGRRLKARVDELLEQLGLTDAADRLVRGFSGGMQRRLDIALGLVARPHVLFLDEPTTALDPETRAELWKEISRLSAEEGISTLMTTHYLEEADRLAAKVVIMDRGRVVAEGTPDGLKGDLRGDAVHIELADPADGEVGTVLEKVDGISELIIDDRVVHARADEGARAVPAILAALDSTGAAVATVTMARPSLDDVYFRHTGRSLRKAEE
jgi:ABC-2 type transport system ATP-binding protein